MGEFKNWKSLTLQREDILNTRFETQTQRIRSLLTQQRSLLIVDNFETVDDEKIHEFLHELPLPTKAIVTTRHRLDLAYPIRLLGMPESDARRLVAQECKKKNVTLTNSHTKRLIARTGGVPLAIVWSIAQMGFGFGTDTVLRRLGRPSEDISRYCFEGAVERICNTDAYDLLIALALAEKDVGRETLGDAVGIGEDILSRDEGLAKLEKLSLIHRSGGRFQMLPLTRMFVLDELNRKPEIQEHILQGWDNLRKQTGVFIDQQTGKVFVKGKEINSLTHLELKVLSYLLEKQGHVCARDELATHLYPEEQIMETGISDNRLDTLIGRLREKIEPNRNHPQYIITVRGRGYKLVEK